MLPYAWKQAGWLFVLPFLAVAMMMGFTLWLIGFLVAGATCGNGWKAKLSTATAKRPFLDLNGHNMFLDFPIVKDRTNFEP